jgi:type IV fimbrial biogenesis protein FimT
MTVTHSARRLRGFTLTEMVVALAIIAIMLTLAAPSYTDLIQQIRLANATTALHDAMNLARFEAIKRNSRVELVARKGSWKNGWDVMAGDQIIFGHEALHEDIHVTSTFLNKSNPYIAYGGTGRTRTRNNANSALAGTIRLTLGKHARLIVVGFLGRVRVCDPVRDKLEGCS